MKRGPLKVRIPNPHGKDIAVPLQRAILRQAGIDESAWEGS